MKHSEISTWSEYLELKTKYKYIILRFSADWCSSCKRIKSEIDEFILNISNIDAIFVDVDYDQYENDEIFTENIIISKLPTFYCDNRFNYFGTNIIEIKSKIHSLSDEINEDF